MVKKQYNADQHYIPRFVLQNFTSNNQLRVADISVSPIRCFTTTPKRICSQKDLYKVKNEDGTYFERNSIEDSFASMEGWFAAQVRDLFLGNDKNSHISGEQDVMLALMLTVQLARLPAAKQIVFGKNGIGTIEKSYIYQALINSNKKAREYLCQNNVSIPSELSQDNEEKTLVDAIASHLASNCFFYIIDASNTEGTFIISDQPVLIRPFEDAQYIFPISPDFAIACCAFDSARGNQVESFVAVSEETVHKINAFSFEQAERFVIAKKFTENHLRILQGRDNKCLAR